MIDSLIVKVLQQTLCLKCTKIRLLAGLRSDPLGELKRSPDRPTRNRGVLLLRERAFQLTGLIWRHNLTDIQGLTGTYSSQWFSHYFNGEQTQEILRRLGLGTQKSANLCLKCTKIRLLAGLRPDPLGELKHSPRPLYPQSRGFTSKGGTLQSTGLRTAQPHWNTRPNVT